MPNDPVVLRSTDRYSEILQGDIKNRYERNLYDENLLHLRNEIALLDVRLQQLVDGLNKMIDGGEDRLRQVVQNDFSDLGDAEQERIFQFVMELSVWGDDGMVGSLTLKRLNAIVKRYERALAAKDLARAKKAMSQLFLEIDQTNSVGELWDEIYELFSRRRSLAETETKYEKETGKVIEVDKVIDILSGLIRSLRGTVNKYVIDAELRENILAETEQEYSKVIDGSGAEGD